MLNTVSQKVVPRPPKLVKKTTKSARKPAVAKIVAKRKVSYLVCKYRFFSLLTSLMLLGVLVILLVTSQGSKRSYELDNKVTYNNKLALKLQKINKEIADATAPGEISIKANELNMVYKDNPIHLEVKGDKKITVFSPSKPAQPVKNTPLDNPIRVDQTNPSQAEDTVNSNLSKEEKINLEGKNSNFAPTSAPAQKNPSLDNSSNLISEKIVRIN